MDRPGPDEEWPLKQGDLVTVGGREVEIVALSLETDRILVCHPHEKPIATVLATRWEDIDHE